MNYIKYNDEVEKAINKYRGQTNLIQPFKYLIENLWPSKYEYLDPKLNKRNEHNEFFIPEDFKRTISIMEPIFKGVQANDAKDLVNFIVMTLHKELNKPQQFQNNLNIPITQIEQTNEDKILKQYFSNFTKENQSVISDLFYMTQETFTNCTGCNKIKYNFEAHFFLVFPLEEVRKSKIEQMKNQFMMNNQNIMNMNPLLYQQNLFIFQSNLQQINNVNINYCYL